MMREHPIEGLMSAAMSSIQDMVDVNTIIGDPIETSNNIVIIPVSKVCFGFAAGGSEFSEETIDEYTRKEKDEESIKYKLPFGGGAGAGVSINPVAFIVVQGENVKLLPVNHSSTMDRLLDYVPDLFEKISKKMCKSKIIKDEINNLIKEDKKENKENTTNTETTKKDEQKEEEYEIEYDETDELDD